MGQVRLAVESEEEITFAFGAKFGGEGLGRDVLGHGGLLHDLGVVFIVGHDKVLNN